MLEPDSTWKPQLDPDLDVLQYTNILPVKRRTLRQNLRDILNIRD